MGMGVVAACRSTSAVKRAGNTKRKDIPGLTLKLTLSNSLKKYSYKFILGLLVERTVNRQITIMNRSRLGRKC